MKHSTPRPNKADVARFSELRDLGCICCRISDALGLVVGDNPLEIHHLLSGGIRRGHGFTICLCRWHHRGIVTGVFNDQWATRYLGPSLAKGSKPFHAAYGSDDHLLHQSDLMLGYRAAA